MCTFSTKGKTISIFPSLEATAPIIYLNTVSGEGQKVFKEAQAVGCPPFTLIAVSGLDWNHDMAPWDSPAAFKKGEPFTSGADDYLRLLVEEIISRAEKELPVPPAWRGIAGYSLAGLFALYAIYQTDVFSRVGCGFPVLRSTSFPTSRSVGRTASTSPWGTRRPRPAIQS